MKRLFVVIFLICATILLAGRSASADGLKDLGDLLDKAGKLAPLVMKDADIGLLFTQGVEKQYGLDQDPQRNTKVQQIGQKILSANKITGKYDFAVLRSHDFNACSIYGGHVRVNEGLLFDTQNNDSEAAFAIAHEIAHNELGHNKAAVKNFRTANALDLANATKKMPQLLLAGANAVMAKRSRENESAADLKALEYMSKAGYNPTGAIAMARRIEAEHTIAQKRAGNSSLVEQRFNSIFDTHPEPAKRAEMAEDFYFQQKYGSTFKQIAGDSTVVSHNYYGDALVLVAHPSLWTSPLRVTNQICGVGIFNPSPLTNEAYDVNYFLQLCGDHLVAATCDNDSHDLLEAIDVPEKGTDTHFTFVQGDYADATALLKAIQLGQTYASCDGIEIQDMNFPIGRDYPKVNYPHLTFKLVYPETLLVRPAVMVYCDGSNPRRFEAESYHQREAKFSIDDKEIEKGQHWYVIYLNGQLITSPITLDVTRNSRGTLNPGGSKSWQKGIVHYHSFYSDGHSKSIQEIWDSGRASSVGFILMTDHADLIKETGDHAYSRYADDCHRASPAMVPGVEYSLRKLKAGFGKGNHILILNPKEYKNYEEIDEEAFFNGVQGEQGSDQVCIIKDQFHIGDDVSQTEMERDALFNFTKTAATLKVWIKGSPFKDPIIWINRHEIGRVITTDNQWHEFTFQVPAEFLNPGQNLYHMESFIPDRWHTFDDCEVRDIYITKN